MMTNQRGKERAKKTKMKAKTKTQTRDWTEQKQRARLSTGDIASATCTGGFEATVPRRAGRGWPRLAVSVAQHVASRRRPASLQALAHELKSRQAPHRDVRA